MVKPCSRSSYDLLGVQVTPLRLEDLLEIVRTGIEHATRVVIGSHNLHSVVLTQSDPKMQCFYDKVHIVYVDGMSLVLLGRMLGIPLRRHHRVTFIDVIHLMMSEASTKGWRVYCLGSRPGVADRAAEVLRAQHPGLQIATWHGYFDVEASSEIVELTNAFKPDIVLVGMGMPKQEHWIVDHLDEIDSKIVFGNLGAILDLVAGVLPTPPRWMGRVGIEWLYRLAYNPRYVWKRYLIEPWIALWLVVKAKQGSG